MNSTYLDNDQDREQLIELGRNLERLDQQKAIGVRLNKQKWFCLGVLVGLLIAHLAVIALTATSAG